MNKEFNIELLAELFEENIKSVQLVLNVILKRTDITVLTVDVKRNFMPEAGYLLKIDIVAIDKKNKKYNIEIGFGNEKATHKITRCSDTIIKTFSSIENRHNVVYMVYITEKDVIGEGLPIYHIETFIDEEDKTIDDGIHLIFVNGEISDDKTALGRLIHDFKCNTIDETEILNC